MSVVMTASTTEADPVAMLLSPVARNTVARTFAVISPMQVLIKICTEAAVVAGTGTALLTAVAATAMVTATGPKAGVAVAETSEVVAVAMAVVALAASSKAAPR